MRGSNHAKMAGAALTTAMTLASCSGPHTPLGSVWVTGSSQVNQGSLAIMGNQIGSTKTEISFDPPRQRFQNLDKLRIIIHDTETSHTVSWDKNSTAQGQSRLVVRYNGLDVSRSYLKQATVIRSSENIVVTIPNIRLSPQEDHFIEVAYDNGLGDPAFARLNAPRCHYSALKVDRSIASIDSNSLTSVSRSSGFNTGFITAIRKQQNQTMAELKSTIQDLRTNVTYWSSPEQEKRLKLLFKDFEDAKLRLSIASNLVSAQVVESALQKRGLAWATDPRIFPHKGKINQILSDCDEFNSDSNNQEVSHESSS